MAPAAPVLWLGDRSESTTTDFDGRLRRCHVLGRLTPEISRSQRTTDRPMASTLLWVRLDPPLVLDGDRFEEVVLKARHVGYDIDRLGDDSISVYVFEIRSKEGFDRGRVLPDALNLLVWADIARDPAYLPETQEEGFDRTLEVLRTYAERAADSNVPQEHREGGIWLGNWVHNTKRAQARGELRADWAQRLAALPGWRWGVDADRDWALAWNAYGTMWLMRHEGVEGTGLDGRLRIGEPIGKSPIEAAEQRPTAWVYVYPPLRLDSDEPGMLVLAVSEAVVDLRGFDRGTVIVEASHVRSWQRMPDGTRRPDEVWNLGRAVVAPDPALLPAMSEEEWRGGLTALRTYRDAIGHCWVPYDYVPNGDHATVIHLGGWALRVRSEHRQGILLEERANELESVAGWRWSWAEG
jgi:hypothetical protein